MEFIIKTREKQELVDITDKVKKIVKDSKAKDGIIVVYTLHSTASIIINENYDPNICLDFSDALNEMVPEGKWRHDRIDDNGDAHIKAAIIGPSQTLIIENTELVLGKWQSIMLADFNGPRERTVKIKIIKN